MAIDNDFARFLISCRERGVNFSKTLTLGRLNYYLSVKETRNLLRWAGWDENGYSQLLDYDSTRYAETFLNALGADTVDSLDASGFEGATMVHDMNQPVPEPLKSRFDAVCDGGTIEHV